jgi:hypothetical protein
LCSYPLASTHLRSPSFYIQIPSSTASPITVSWQSRRAALRAIHLVEMSLKEIIEQIARAGFIVRKVEGMGSSSPSMFLISEILDGMCDKTKDY